MSWADFQRGQEPIERLLKYIKQTNTGCWVFALLNGKGYGKLTLWDAEAKRRRDIAAYKFAYEYFIGPVPEGLELDHLCHTPACVNPTHLEPVTHAVNQQRRLWCNQPTFACGHPKTPENTYTKIVPEGTRSKYRKPGWRAAHCRICKRAYQRRPAYLAKQRVRVRKWYARRVAARKGAA